MQQIILDTLITGLPYLPVIMGIYIIFRLREDFDLTLDGSFAMGGALTAVLLTHAVSVPVAILASILASCACGLVTAALHLTLRIPVILAGLIMSIGLFSVNLRVMGQPTMSVTGLSTLFSNFANLSSPWGDLATVGVMVIVAGIVTVLIGLFLKTEYGLALRASGINVKMARSHGVNDNAYLCLSLAAANGLSGLSGSLVVQSQGFVDINMGVGVMIAGVGAVLLGELLTRPTGSKVLRIILAVVLGALAYRLILVASLRAGLPASDLKGVTAVVLIAAVAAQRWGGAWTRLSRVVKRPNSRKVAEFEGGAVDA